MTNPNHDHDRQAEHYHEFGCLVLEASIGPDGIHMKEPRIIVIRVTDQDLLDHGFDGNVTNLPDILRQIHEEREAANPQPIDPDTVNIDDLINRLLL